MFCASKRVLKPHTCQQQKQYLTKLRSQYIRQLSSLTRANTTTAATSKIKVTYNSI